MFMMTALDSAGSPVGALDPLSLRILSDPCWIHWNEQDEVKTHPQHIAKKPDLWLDPSHCFPYNKITIKTMKMHHLFLL